MLQVSLMLWYPMNKMIQKYLVNDFLDIFGQLVPNFTDISSNNFRYIEQQQSNYSNNVSLRFTLNKKKKLSKFNRKIWQKWFHYVHWVFLIAIQINMVRIPRCILSKIVSTNWHYMNVYQIAATNKKWWKLLKNLIERFIDYII